MAIFCKCTFVKVLVRRSAKKRVLVGARAKGEMCCVQMNVNVNIFLHEKTEQLDNVKSSLPRNINQTIMNASLTCTFDDIRETINESQNRCH